MGYHCCVYQLMICEEQGPVGMSSSAVSMTRTRYAAARCVWKRQRSSPRDCTEIALRYAALLQLPCSYTHSVFTRQLVCKPSVLWHKRSFVFEWMAVNDGVAVLKRVVVS